MAEQFCGTWRLIDSKNFDEYMKALGVSLTTVKIGNMTKPTVIISQDGDKIVIKTQTTYKNTEITFKLGVEFDENTMDNRQCKSLVIMDEGKMTHVQKWEGSESSLIREIKDGKMILTLLCEGVECVRTYEKA